MFKINSKEYKAKEIDFNSVIEMKDLGGDIYEMGRNPFAVIRAYLAFCGGMTADKAGEEINAHVVGGGDLAVLSETLNDALEKSDFFKAMVARAKKAESDAKA